MDFLVAWMFIGAFIVVPGLLNYYTNRWFSAAGAEPNRWELLAAGFVLSFVLLTVAAMITLLVAIGYHDLREQLSEFVNKGFRTYAADRPFALSGVLTAVALATMALMTAFGWLRIPARYLR
jgi:ABC-type spermidine/putrescine transport system permease subunit II